MIENNVSKGFNETFVKLNPCPIALLHEEVSVPRGKVHLATVPCVINDVAATRRSNCSLWPTLDHCVRRCAIAIDRDRSWRGKV